MTQPNELDSIKALLAHAHIAERKAGIARAERLLQADQCRDQLLPLLEQVASYDLMITVREEAERVLREDRQRRQPPARPDESPHIIHVTCSKGHVSHFDRRRICPPSSKFKRETVTRGGKQIDEMYLKCTTCGAEVIVDVDCEGYR